MIVDASADAAWFVDEPWSLAAMAILTEGHALVAPELLAWETCGAVLRRYRRLGKPEREIEHVHEELLGLVRLIPAAPLLSDARRIAADYGGAVIDSGYVALALRSQTPLATADAGQAEMARRAGVRVRVLE